VRGSGLAAAGQPNRGAAERRSLFADQCRIQGNRSPRQQKGDDIISGSGKVCVCLLGMGGGGGGGGDENRERQAAELEALESIFGPQIVRPVRKEEDEDAPYVVEVCFIIVSNHSCET
jgi:hypothetical protein